MVLTLSVYKPHNANVENPAATIEVMDSIQLIESTFGHFGDHCVVTVTTGDIYNGIFRGYGDAVGNIPMLLLEISESEATRIGIPYLAKIGIRYDVITSMKF